MEFIIPVIGAFIVIFIWGLSTGEFEIVTKQDYENINNKITNSNIEYASYPHTMYRGLYGNDLHVYEKIGTVEEHWEMIKDVHDDLKYIFGEEWESLLQRYYCDRGFKNINSSLNGFRNVWYIAWELSLSKKGFIPSYRVYSGYNLSEGIYGVEIGEDYNISLKTCNRISKNINNKHPELSLYLDSYSSNSNRLYWNHHIKYIDTVNNSSADFVAKDFL